MNKQEAIEILNRYPGLIAFIPASADHAPEVCLEGWFCPEAVLAIAWWMQNLPNEDWWREPDGSPRVSHPAIRSPSDT